MKKRLILVCVTALAVLGLAACTPEENFKQAVAVEANNLRAAYGRPGLPRNSWLEADAQTTANNCAGAHQTSLANCHLYTPGPENIAVEGGCRYGGDQANHVVWGQWGHSGSHLAFLIDYGWPPKHGQGVGVACDPARDWLYIVWAGA